MEERSGAQRFSTLERVLFIGSSAGLFVTAAESTLLFVHAWKPRAESVHIAEAILAAGGVYCLLGLLVAGIFAGILFLDNIRLRARPAAAALEVLVDRATALLLVACFSIAMSSVVNRAALMPSPIKRLAFVVLAVVIAMVLAVAVSRLMRYLVSNIFDFFYDRRRIVAFVFVAFMVISALALAHSPHSQFAYTVLLAVFGVGGALLVAIKRGPWSRPVVRTTLSISVLWTFLFFVRGMSPNAFLMHRMGRTLVSVILREIPYHRMAPFETTLHAAILTRFETLPHADTKQVNKPVGLEEPTRADSERPDIVLLTIDTLREDRLSSSPTKMPFLSAIAAEGALFRNAFACAPSTIGAMTQVMTGRTEHDVRHLVLWNSSNAPLDPSTKTVASSLLAHGYETVAIVGGKLVSYYPSFGLGFSKIVEQKEDGSPLLAGDIIDNYKKIATRPDSHSPLFVWLHFLEPHNHTDRPLPIPEGYNAIVGEIDAEIGRLYAFLKASAHFETTNLLVLADHGEGLGERGFVYHGVSIPVDMRIPLVARFPGEQPAIINDLVSQLDIAPTILAAAGLQTQNLPGRSLQKKFADITSPRQYAVFENVLHVNPLYPHEFGVAAPPWYYVFDMREQRSILINLDEDPLGLTNLAEEQPEQARRLAKVLVDQLASE